MYGVDPPRARATPGLVVGKGTISRAPVTSDGSPNSEPNPERRGVCITVSNNDRLRYFDTDINRMRRLIKRPRCLERLNCEDHVRCVI